MSGANGPGQFVEPHRETADEVEARAALVLGLRRRGIGDRAVLSAIERVPRRLFLSAVHHNLAYDDAALPIECGQVVSAPSFVARVMQELELKPEHSVLEVGTGSGYQAAVLSHLAGRVESVDRYQTLVDLAGQRTAALKLKTVRIHHADGLLGLSAQGPYDRIVLNGSVTEIPQGLFAQLKPGGILIAPLGIPREPQTLIKLNRAGGSEERRKLGVVRMISLLPGLAGRL